MTKQEKIREGIARHFRPHTLGDVEDDLSGFISCTGTMELWRYQAEELMEWLDSQGVVIKVDRELPYKWKVITKNHSYPPHKKFTTYALLSRQGKMFGYAQKYQSLTGYKCFEKPVRFCIYLGNEEQAYSDKSFTTLRKAKEHLMEQFLASKDNPDNEIPTGYVAVEGLI